MTFENKKNIEYSIIAAVAENWVIGNGLKIPWHIPEDFQLFKEKTNNSVVIMGQNTWDSLPIKPLPNRINIVLNKDKKENEEPNKDAKTFTNFDDAFNYAQKQDKEIFVIGGASIYNQTIQNAKYLYISHVNGEFEGNILFPEFNPKDYILLERKKFKDFTFKKYKIKPQK